MNQLPWQRVSLVVALFAAITVLAAAARLTKRTLNSWVRQAAPIFDQSAAYEMLTFMSPDVAFLEVPGILFAVAFLVCVQLALICVWRLLSLVRASVIFSEDAFKWVTGILALVVIATLLILGALVTFQLSGVSVGPLTVICLLGVILGAGFALLVVVLRGLLRQASQLERDLSEVV